VSWNSFELIMFCCDVSIKCVLHNNSLFLRCVSGLIDYFLRPLRPELESEFVVKN